MSDFIVVGNGLSRKKFNFTEIKRALNAPLAACNLGYMDLPYDYLFAIDDQIIEELIANNIEYIPVPDVMKWEPIELHGLFRPRNNTGMVAITWAIQQGYKNLHIYGFDFLLEEPEKKMSNVFAGHPLYGADTACSVDDSYRRMTYLDWMIHQNSDVKFNFYFPKDKE